MNKVLFFLGFVIVLCSCNAGKVLYKKGLKLYEKTEFEDAVQYFTASLDEGYSPSKINYRLAESYRQSNRMALAEPYYKAALDANTYEEDAKFYYALSLKFNGKYEDAKEAFDLYLKSGKNDALFKRCREELKNLVIIDSLKQMINYIEVKNLTSLNTSVAEFSPVWYQNTLLFTSARKEKIFKSTGTNFLGIYSFKFRDLEDFKGIPSVFSDIINEDGVHEGSPTFSKNGQMMVFAKSNNGEKEGTDNVDLYVSQLFSDGWSIPVVMPDVNDLANWDSTPFISPDGKKLYFSSNRKGGFGGTDLYVADLTPNGKAKSIRNLGPKINTIGNELFPAVGDDGRLLFSSDGHVGFGGLDIFSAVIASGNKVTIRNLGVPFNSSADDFGIIYKDDSTGFFSSNRIGGKGDDDIYFFTDRTPKNLQKKVNYYLRIETVTLNEADSTDIIVPNVQIGFYDSEGKELQAMESDEKGRTKKIPVELHKDFLITASKQPDYFKTTEYFTTQGRAIPQEFLTKPVTDTTIIEKVYLDKIILDRPIVLENIYYDVNQAYIRPDAAIELDKLVKILEDNPQIIIELSSHTDSRNTDDYNMKLSQSRAESAVNYLVEKNINPRRLKAQGYGEHNLIIANAATEEDHQRNRRTEFKVIRILEDKK